MKTRRSEELERIIADENLKPEAARSFVDDAFRDGAIPSTGPAITTILPPISRFSRTNAHEMKKQVVLDKLTVFFERFFGLV